MFIGFLIGMLVGAAMLSPLFKSIRRKDAALRESGEKLRNVTSNIGEGIYTLDVEGKITFMNPMAENLLGWTAEELNAGGPHDSVHFMRPDGSHLPFDACMMHNVIKTGRPYESTDEVFIRKDGTAFPISVITTPIIENGRVSASVTAFRDISDVKQIEKEREKLIAELQEALANIKTLKGLLPVCAWCGKVRDDEGYWTKVEEYIEKHTGASFTHGICPVCLSKVEEEELNK